MTENGNLIALPETEAYASTMSAYFSQQETSIAPSCVIKPQRAGQVAEIVSTIVAHGACQFAVKGQGNAPSPGFANIENGIVIDITGLNSVSVSEDHSVASVGAGAKWADVYAFLEPLDKTVAGGRLGGVGVGGLTLGGGISFFSPQVGFTCDTVTNFQVVLADGQLLEANDNSHPDLFRALKGGMNNFGVVTRIDYKTLPLPGGEVLGGLIINPFSELNRVLKALNGIINNPEYDIHASILTCGIFESTTKDWTLMSSPVYTKPVRNPSVYKELFACTNIKDMMKLQKLTTMVNFPAMPKERVSFHTATYGSTFEFLRLIFDYGTTIFSQGPQGVKWTVALEPLPAAAYEYGSGSNVLGTAGAEGNNFIFFVTASWADPSIDEAARATAQKLLSTINAAAGAVGLLRRFVYINYADPSQDPFASYGEESRAFLQKVAKDYDPSGVFQKLVPGGFKLT